MDQTPCGARAGSSSGDTVPVLGTKQHEYTQVLDRTQCCLRVLTTGSQAHPVAVPFHRLVQVDGRRCRDPPHGIAQIHRMEDAPALGAWYLVPRRVTRRAAQPAVREEASVCYLSPCAIRGCHPNTFLRRCGRSVKLGGRLVSQGYAEVAYLAVRYEVPNGVIASDSDVYYRKG